MELTNTTNTTNINNENNENNEASEDFINPTPKLKSSPIIILFLSFKEDEETCNFCGNEYSRTLLFEQKYCRNCLFWYRKYINENTTDKATDKTTDKTADKTARVTRRITRTAARAARTTDETTSNTTGGAITYSTSYLDLHIRTKKIQCNMHKRIRHPDFYSQYVQEWCECCSEISYFTQVVPYFYLRERIDTPKSCKLCGRYLYTRAASDIEFRLCPDCYIISSGWIESTLTKKPIPILYLPWWDIVKICRLCRRNLKYISDCQKWCSYCYIVLTGCRYCLTTNMIFGIIDQSQCRKCKRILFLNIDVGNFSSGNKDVDEFLNSTININYHQIASFMKNVDPNYPLHIYTFNIDNFRISSLPKMRWIPYSQITNLKRIAEGGFGVIYKATWLSDEFFGYEHIVAIKKFINSNISKYFLKELNSLYQCYNPTCIIRCYGITQDPTTKEYMLIMDYADEVHLRNYLQKNFVTWDKPTSRV